MIKLREIESRLRAIANGTTRHSNSEFLPLADALLKEIQQLELVQTVARNTEHAIPSIPNPQDCFVCGAKVTVEVELEEFEGMRRMDGKVVRRQEQWRVKIGCIDDYCGTIRRSLHSVATSTHGWRIALVTAITEWNAMRKEVGS